MHHNIKPTCTSYCVCGSNISRNHFDCKVGVVCQVPFAQQCVCSAGFPAQKRHEADPAGCLGACTPYTLQDASTWMASRRVASNPAICGDAGPRQQDWPKMTVFLPPEKALQLEAVCWRRGVGGIINGGTRVDGNE